MEVHIPHPKHHTFHFPNLEYPHPKHLTSQTSTSQTFHVSNISSNIKGYLEHFPVPASKMFATKNSCIFSRKVIVIFWEMRLSSWKIRKCLTISGLSPLNFCPKIFLYFFLKKLLWKNFFYFLIKAFLILRKWNFSYIPGKAYLELWHNGTFLYFVKGKFRNLA